MQSIYFFMLCREDEAMKSKIGIIIFCLSLFFVVACGGGGGGDTGVPGGSTGTINLSLSDASTTDYKAIYVTVREVAVQKDGGGGWTVISSPDKTYNLLNLVNGVREDLALATLASGHYTQMRLILTDTPDNSLNILSTNHPYGNYFIDKNNKCIALKVPSGFQTGIKIVKGFDINTNQTTELILDFDAARSIIKAGNSGQWLLKPTIKLLETKDYSIIEGNAGAEGVLVSAQIYNASGAVEDKVQIVAATVSNAGGNYKLFLEPGSYTLVGYQDGFSPFFKNTKVVTVAGNTYTENFSLSSSSPTGTLAGTVEISGADPEQYSTISIRQNATVNGNSEQIEVKSLNVANGGTFTTSLPSGSYVAVISTYGKTALESTFDISSNLTTDIGNIIF
jgi:hypothetical protein